MKEKIWLSAPHMGGEEISFIREAFDTNWISPVGPHITAFEDALATYTGVGHCAALSSGTAAIHLALIILDVRQHDEVICSSLTFSGSCNPIAYQRATPVFVDAEPDTWNIDPRLMEIAIEDRIRVTGRKPKAVIIVHLYGMPAKVDELMAVARKYDIPVIEDAAEALGGSFRGKKLGSFGDIGIFSFNGNKIITTSGGGALVSNSASMVQRARFLSTQARDAAPHYQHSEIGYNYRLSNISAGIGRGQLKVLDDRVHRRRAVFDLYVTKLSALKGLEFLPEPSPEYFSNRWLTTILITPERSGCTSEMVREKLAAENIETRPIWKPMHLQPVFAQCPAYTNGTADRLFETGLCLPSSSSLTDTHLERICDGLHTIWSS